jgi:murein peptide amidase A
MSGCQTLETSDPLLQRPAYRAAVVGRSVEGRPLMVRVYGNGDDVVLLMAGIHGNEAAGVPVLERLGRELMDRPELLAGRTVVILPQVNPDGVKANKRRNANGVDLNRNFPADNFKTTKGHGDEPLSQPESRAVLKQIERYKPNRIVTFHQPLTCLDYDGEGAQAIAEAMGEHTDLPVKPLGGRPGSLGSFFGIDRGIPCITFELPKNARDMSDKELWDRYGQATLAAVVYPQPLDAK